MEKGLDYQVEARILKLLQKPTHELTKEEAFWLLNMEELINDKRIRLMRAFPKAIGRHLVIDAQTESLYSLPLKIVIYNTEEDRALETKIYTDENLETLLSTLQRVRTIHHLFNLQDKIRHHVAPHVKHEWENQRKSKNHKQI